MSNNKSNENYGVNLQISGLKKADKTPMINATVPPPKVKKK
ncbi:hypothetical protein [Brachyspira pulli]